MNWTEYAALMDAIDERFVEEAACVKTKWKQNPKKKIWAICAAAACLILIAGAAFSIAKSRDSHTKTPIDGSDSVSVLFRELGLNAEKISEPFLLSSPEDNAMPAEEYSALLKESSVVQVSLHNPEYTLVSGEKENYYYLTADATVEELLWGTVPTENFRLCSAVSAEAVPDDKFVSEFSLDGKCTDCSWLVAIQPSSETSWEIDGERIFADTISAYCVSQVVAPVPDCLQLVAKEDVFLYKYVGNSAYVDIPGLDFTLTLPEEWSEGIDIYLESTMEGPNYNTLIVSNRSLSGEYARHFPGAEDNAISKVTDGILRIHWVPLGTWDYSEDVANGYCVDCGTKNGYQYVMYATGQENPEDSSSGIMRYMLLEEIGQERYYALVGDYQCTPDEAKSWLTFRNR